MSNQPSVEEIMQQAQKIQEELQKAQERLEKTTIIGEAGAGLVKITLTGRFACTNVHIDESLLKESKTVLQDLVKGAVNDAVTKVERLNQESVAGMMGGAQQGQPVNIADTIKPRLS